MSCSVLFCASLMESVHTCTLYNNLNWGLWVTQSKNTVPGNRCHSWIITLMLRIELRWVYVHEGLLRWHEVALCSVCTVVGPWSVWSCCWREEPTQTTRTSLVVLLCTSLREMGTGLMLPLIRAWLALDFANVVVTEKDVYDLALLVKIRLLWLAIDKELSG